MNPSGFEQRNPYKGSPPRAWLAIRIKANDGSIEEIQLLADTGCPQAFIISEDALLRLSWGFVSNAQSNFGQMIAGWLTVEMQELNLQLDLLGYGSNKAVAATKRSHPDFAGLVGLPFLRLVEFGGDADSFWVRPLPSSGN